MKAKCHWAIEGSLLESGTGRERLRQRNFQADFKSLNPPRRFCRHVLSHDGARSREIEIKRTFRGDDRHRRQHAYAQRRSGQVSRTEGFSLSQIVRWSIRAKLRLGGLVNGETVEIAFVSNGDFDHARVYSLGIGAAQAATRTRFKRP